MITKSDGIIYESPDGGNTVYGRSFGDGNRVLISGQAAINKLYRLEKWKHILELGETNAELRTALDKVEVIYELIKGN